MIIKLLPVARKITDAEKNNKNTEDRVLGLESLFAVVLVLFGVLIVFGLGMSLLGGLIEENSALQHTLIMIFISMFGLLLLILFISDIRIVISDGRITAVSSDQGGKIRTTLPIAGLTVFLIFYACIEGSKGNPRGAYPLYVLLGYLVVRSLFRMTLKPLAIAVAAGIRKKQCTVPVRADFFRKIRTHKALSEKVRQRYEEQGRIVEEKFDNILVYDYSFEEQYYRITLNERYCTDTENYNYFDIYIAPDRPERFIIKDNPCFRADKKEMYNAFLLLFFILLFSSPIWLIRFFQFIADHV